MLPIVKIRERAGRDDDTGQSSNCDKQSRIQITTKTRQTDGRISRTLSNQGLEKDRDKGKECTEVRILLRLLVSFEVRMRSRRRCRQGKNFKLHQRTNTTTKNNR